ncbi:RNaseH domain-containing protein [Nonomuraea wenchangensis]
MSPKDEANIPGWNPGLVEIAVLGCHQDDGDHPESLALAVHQLRQPPDPAGDGASDPAMAAGLFTEPDPEEERQASPPDL